MTKTQHQHYPECLIDPEELATVVNSVKIIDASWDSTAYSEGHIPGAICWDFQAQLRASDGKSILSSEEFCKLLGESGISPDDTLVLYGDNHNWFACWAIWMLKQFGHQRVFLLDGGVNSWLSCGYPLTQELPPTQSVSYSTETTRVKDRSLKEDVIQAISEGGNARIVDVRSNQEFTGRAISPHCHHAGSIPTAINVPWRLNIEPNLKFKRPEVLYRLYESFDVRSHHEITTYCAIGERASFTWFVLSQLLGYRNVRVYDHSFAGWCGTPEHEKIA